MNLDVEALTQSMLDAARAAKIDFPKPAPATMSNGGTSSVPTSCASCAGICDSASAEFSMSAPRKIMKIIALVSAAPRKLRRIAKRSSSRFMSPATNVPTAPTAAPSVGVKMPP